MSFYTYSEHSLRAVTSLLATEKLRLNWISSERSEISVRAATALATTFISNALVLTGGCN